MLFYLVISQQASLVSSIAARAFIVKYQRQHTHEEEPRHRHVRRISRILLSLLCMLLLQSAFVTFRQIVRACPSMLNAVKMRGLGIGLAAVRRAEAEADERDEASSTLALFTYT